MHVTVSPLIRPVGMTFKGGGGGGGVSRFVSRGGVSRRGGVSLGFQVHFLFTILDMYTAIYFLTI